MAGSLRTARNDQGNGRTMRIIPWNDLADGAPCYTLVLEWWRSGVVVEDERRMMDAEEAQGLLASLQEALAPGEKREPTACGL